MENTRKKEIHINKNEIKEILGNIKLVYFKLFELYSKLNSKSEDIIIIDKESILNIYEYFKFEEEYFSKIEKIFIYKIIYSLLNNYKKYNKISDSDIEEIEKENENKFNKIDLKNDEILFGLSNIKEIDLDTIILNIIFYFLKCLSYKKNSDLVKKWENIGLCLENFKINERIKKGLSSFLDKNNIIEDYCKELNLRDDPNILNQLYNYLKYLELKESKKPKIKSLKECGDYERINDDYGRDILLNEDIIQKPIFNPDTQKLDDKILNEALSYLKLECNLNLEKPTCEAYLKNDSFNLCKFAVYNESNERERNYKRYLWFIDILEKYIDKMLTSKKIKLKTKITLELKPSNNDSIERLNNHSSYKKITCESSFEYKKQKFEFKDEDILKNGLRGNVPGFIFLINELCNDDYDDKINN